MQVYVDILTFWRTLILLTKKPKLPKSGSKSVEQMRKETDDIAQNKRRKKQNNERYKLFIMRVH